MLQMVGWISGIVLIFFWPLFFKLATRLITKDKEKGRFLFLIQVFWLVAAVFLIRSFFWNMVIICPTEKKSFEYRGCTVEYREIVKKKFFWGEGCLPCGGIIPCMAGFGHNEKVAILKCLCEGGQLQDAQAYARDNFYPSEDPEVVKKDHMVSEVELSDICNNLPEQMPYL